MAAMPKLIRWLIGNAIAPMNRDFPEYGCGHKPGISLAKIEQQVLHDDGNAEGQNERGRGEVLCPSCCLPNHGPLHDESKDEQHCDDYRQRNQGVDLKESQ